MEWNVEWNVEKSASVRSFLVVRLVDSTFTHNVVRASSAAELPACFTCLMSRQQ